MKNIILIAVVVVAGYFFFKKSGVQEKLSDIFESQITISDLQSRPSVFADSLVVLHNLRVVESQSLLNYTRSKISDGTGAELVLLSSRPYSTGESVDEVKGRLTVVYADSERRCEVFISDDLKPFSDLMKVIKHSLLF